MKNKITVYCFALLLASSCYGQTVESDEITVGFPGANDTSIQITSPDTSLLQKALNTDAPLYHPIDKQSWLEETEGMSYNEKSEPQKPLQDTPIEEDNDIKPLISSEFVKVIAFITVAALLFFILYRIFGRGIRANPELRVSTTEILDDLDERPMESDLDRYLKQALTEQDYRLAVRIYYLMLLKALHDKNIITWRKEKTNYDYLRELHKHPEIKRLNNSTLLFEYIWYGDKAVNASEFHGIQPGFISLIEQIRKG